MGKPLTNQDFEDISNFLKDVNPKLILGMFVAISIIFLYFAVYFLQGVFNNLEYGQEN